MGLGFGIRKKLVPVKRHQIPDQDHWSILRWKVPVCLKTINSLTPEESMNLREERLGAVLGIPDILVRIRIRTNGSGSDSFLQ
jgi:hypothetical protein